MTCDQDHRRSIIAACLSRTREPRAREAHVLINAVWCPTTHTSHTFPTCHGCMRVAPCMSGFFLTRSDCTDLIGGDISGSILLTVLSILTLSSSIRYHM